MLLVGLPYTSATKARQPCEPDNSQGTPTARLGRAEALDAQHSGIGITPSPKRLPPRCQLLLFLSLRQRTTMLSARPCQEERRAHRTAS